MLILNQKRGTLPLENSELCGFASLEMGNHFSVKGQILNILSFEGCVVSVETEGPWTLPCRVKAVVSCIWVSE